MSAPSRTSQPRPTQLEPSSIARATHQSEDALGTRRHDRALRATYGLAGLLASRPDLRGIYRPADRIDDAITWCA